MTLTAAANAPADLASGPKPVRRVVIGNKNGVPAVLSDERRLGQFESWPEFSNTLLWTTPPQPQVGSPELAQDPVPATASFLPPVGGTSFMIVTFPPDSQMADPSFNGPGFGEEVGRKVPGLAQTFESDDPAMHTTDTVDYGIVLEGEIWLDLGQDEVHLHKHDVVIQNGARHGWRNKSNTTTTMLFVLIGAQRTL